jgi:hypothetical protein
MVAGIVLELVRRDARGARVARNVDELRPDEAEMQPDRGRARTAVVDEGHRPSSGRATPFLTYEMVKNDAVALPSPSWMTTSSAVAV